MLPNCLLYAVALIFTGLLLFLLIYFVINLADVECDAMNGQQCCSSLNIWVVPKVASQAFLLILLLLAGKFYLVAANLPMISWHIYQVQTIPRGNIGLYDPTEIFNRRMVRKYVRDCLISVGFYLIMFFVYVYCMINALLEGDPIRRHEEEEFITDL